MRAAEMAAASLGLGSALSPVFVRPNSTSLRALVSGSAGIGGEIAALRMLEQLHPWWPDHKLLRCYCDACYCVPITITLVLLLL